MVRFDIVGRVLKFLLVWLSKDWLTDAIFRLEHEPKRVMRNFVGFVFENAEVGNPASFVAKEILEYLARSLRELMHGAGDARP